MTKYGQVFAFARLGRPAAQAGNNCLPVSALALITSLSLALPQAALCWPFHKEPKNIVFLGGTERSPNPALGTPNPVQSSTNKPSVTPLLKGEVTYVVPRGTPIKLKISAVPEAAMHLANRDEEGNLLPAQLGEKLSAKTSEDIYVGDNKVIPEGTVFHGIVSKIIPPKRMGRPGSLELSFDRFTTPDGKSFAFHAVADNTRPSTWKTKAQGLGTIAAHTAGGAIFGALVAYQIFGLQNTIALHGYNIAGGAAAGALLGTTVGVMRHGRPAVLEPGDDLNMSIDVDMLLPAAVAPRRKAPEPQLEGFDIQVLKSKVIKDGLDGHMLMVDAIITNNSRKHLSSVDLYLEDDNGNQFPIAAGLDEESEYLFHIDPHTRQRISFCFQLDYPKLKRKLVWYDHQSRRPLIKAPLP